MLAYTMSISHCVLLKRSVKVVKLNWCRNRFIGNQLPVVFGVNCRRHQSINQGRSMYSPPSEPLILIRLFWFSIFFYENSFVRCYYSSIRIIYHHSSIFGLGVIFEQLTVYRNPMFFWNRDHNIFYVHPIALSNPFRVSK